MTPRGVSIGAGILVVVLGGIWLRLVMAAPTLTYDIRYGEVVRLECQSIHGLNDGGVRAPAVKNVEGTAKIERTPDSATISGSGTTDDDANILVISEAQLSADCAGARIERLQWIWAPAILVVLGLGLASLGGRRVAPPSRPYVPLAGPPPPQA